MLTKNGLENKIIKGSNEIIFYYVDVLKNDIIANEEFCMKEIKKYKNIYYNYEEASSILAVYYINKLLSIYHNDKDILNNRYAAKLAIFDYDDIMLKTINTYSSFDLNFDDYWDEKVQELYNLMGYTDKLPTHSEIRKIDILIQNKKRNGDNLTEILELQKEMDLKKCKLGELDNQFDEDMPVIFSENVIDNYDIYIKDSKIKSLKK